MYFIRSYTMIGWRFAPPHKYTVKYIQQKQQQKQQRQQQQNLFCQFIQLNIPGQKDFELNDLAKQILMLLPLLLLLYVFTT